MAPIDLSRGRNGGVPPASTNANGSTTNHPPDGGAHTSDFRVVSAGPNDTNLQLPHSHQTVSQTSNRGRQRGDNGKFRQGSRQYNHLFNNVQGASRGGGFSVSPHDFPPLMAPPLSTNQNGQGRYNRRSNHNSGRQFDRAWSNGSNVPPHDGSNQLQNGFPRSLNRPRSSESNETAYVKWSLGRNGPVTSRESGSCSNDGYASSVDSANSAGDGLQGRSHKKNSRGKRSERGQYRSQRSNQRTNSCGPTTQRSNHPNSNFSNLPTYPNPNQPGSNSFQTGRMSTTPVNGTSLPPLSQPPPPLPRTQGQHDLRSNIHNGFPSNRNYSHSTYSNNQYNNTPFQDNYHTDGYVNSNNHRYQSSTADTQQSHSEGAYHSASMGSTHPQVPRSEGTNELQSRSGETRVVQGGLQSELQEEMARAQLLNLPVRFNQMNLNPSAGSYKPPEDIRDAYGQPFKMTYENGVCSFSPQTPNTRSDPNLVIPAAEIDGSSQEEDAPPGSQTCPHPTQNCATTHGHIVCTQQNTVNAQGQIVCTGQNAITTPGQIVCSGQNGITTKGQLCCSGQNVISAQGQLCCPGQTAIIPTHPSNSVGVDGSGQHTGYPAVMGPTQPNQCLNSVNQYTHPGNPIGTAQGNHVIYPNVHVYTTQTPTTNDQVCSLPQPSASHNPPPQYISTYGTPVIAQPVPHQYDPSQTQHTTNTLDTDTNTPQNMPAQSSQPLQQPTAIFSPMVTNCAFTEPPPMITPPTHIPPPPLPHQYLPTNGTPTYPGRFNIVPLHHLPLTPVSGTPGTPNSVQTPQEQSVFSYGPPVVPDNKEAPVMNLHAYWATYDPSSSDPAGIIESLSCPKIKDTIKTKSNHCNKSKEMDKLARQVCEKLIKYVRRYSGIESDKSDSELTEELLCCENIRNFYRPNSNPVDSKEESSDEKTPDFKGKDNHQDPANT